MNGVDSSSTEREYNWREIEKQVGLSLPQDYKIISAACRGLRVSSIVPRPPQLEGDFNGILQATEDDAEIMHDLYDVELGQSVVPTRKGGSPLPGHAEDEPFDFHPGKPGLLTWRKDTMGGSYYWHTKGHPDQWTVVAYARDGWWESHAMSMSEYLIGIATGSVHCEVPPKRFQGWGMFGVGE